MAEGERERSQPPVLRATSFQRKEGKAVKNHLPPSQGRGMPEGQGVGRRRKSAKPTSGAARHLLPEEGGRSGMSNPSTPFPWKGDARRAGGWPKEKESEANLRRYAPPPSRGRRESGEEPISFPVEGRSGKKPSTPFPWKGDARRAGGWPKAKESEANLRRYAPPPSRGRRETW